MRPRRNAVLGAALVLLALVAGRLAADEATKNLVSKVLDSFDDPSKSLWIVQGSRFATKGFPQLGFVTSWPEALYGKNKEKLDLKSLGIHGRFDRKAYNYIEIIPAARGSDGKLAPSPIAFPGRVQTLDVWVWGSNYNYWLDVHLRDYRGVDHVLTLGQMVFAGWKNLSVDIPGSIPQSAVHIPRLRGLELTKLVLWTRPDEAVDDFYLFIDQVKVLTDLFESRFDGDELADLEYLNQIWAASKNQ